MNDVPKRFGSSPNIEADARRQIADYESKGRIDASFKDRPAPFPVEEGFDDVVLDFGVVKMSVLLQSKAQMRLTPDYLFDKENVIAELKTLEGVYSGSDGGKSLAQAYIDAGCSRGDLMGLIWRGEPIPPRVKALIARRIRRSLEQRIKKARK